MAERKVTTKAELLRLIDQAADEGWTELDLAGLGLEELPTEIQKLESLEILRLGRINQQSSIVLRNNFESLPIHIFSLKSLKVLEASFNPITEIPAEISQLENLQKITIGSARICDFPEEICNLNSLSELFLGNFWKTDTGYTIAGGNRIKNLPESVTRLNNLKRLDLSCLRFSEWPKHIDHINSLRYLNLSNNKISDIPDTINQLQALQEIDLTSNRFSCIPDSISNLKSLHVIHFGENEISHISDALCSMISLKELFFCNKFKGNKISQIPDAISQLQNLQILDLSRNKISDIPNVISQLQNLRELHLGGNNISCIPDTVCKLRNLEKLVLGDVFSLNQISQIPNTIVQLQSLKILQLSGNQISEIPDAIAQLQSLNSLDFSSNQISEIPDAIAQLQSLNSLSLFNNRISEIPDEITQLPHLEKLDLRKNPLPIAPEILGPPNEFEEPGTVKAILNYWQQLRSGEVRPLNEAKLLLVGQGSVGKTSLINRLLNDKFDNNESQTDGLAVHDWQIHVNSKDIRLNVWDFGGQEIYHATHQFFLTKRSLYLLVCNCRTSEEENRLEYWLKLIQSFGGSSPVIIVGNKNDEQPLDINQRALRDKYPNIKAILQTSCQSGAGIAELKQAIEKEVGQLKEVYDLLPLKWFEVKQQLEAMDQDFIKYSQYERLCEDQDIPEDHNQEQLIRLLHDLGLVLNYRDHPILSDTNVLNPDWVTEGIYALLSDDELKTKTKGILQPTDLSRILDPKRYPPRRHIFLTELLKQFQLGFELPNCPTQKRFLLPGLLPKEEPRNTTLDGKTLEFQYHYKVLPASVLSRFIVLMHEKIHQQTYWRSGVMLAYCEGDETFNLARIKADPEDKKVFISISGRETTRRTFLGMIRDTFRTIHNAFADPEDVTEWVPVPDHPNADPLEYKELLGLEEMGDSTVTIGKLKLRLDLRQLLDGYEPHQQRQQRNQGGSDNSVQVIIKQGDFQPNNTNFNQTNRDNATGSQAKAEPGSSVYQADTINSTQGAAQQNAPDQTN